MREHLRGNNGIPPGVTVIQRNGTPCVNIVRGDKGITVLVLRSDRIDDTIAGTPALVEEVLDFIQSCAANGDEDDEDDPSVAEVIAEATGIDRTRVEILLARDDFDDLIAYLGADGVHSVVSAAVDQHGAHEFLGINAGVYGTGDYPFIRSGDCQIFVVHPEVNEEFYEEGDEERAFQFLQEIRSTPGPLRGEDCHDSIAAAARE